MAQRAATMRQAAVDYDRRRHGRWRWHSGRRQWIMKVGGAVGGDNTSGKDNTAGGEDLVVDRWILLVDNKGHCREVTVVIHRQSKPHNDQTTRNRDGGIWSATMGILSGTIN